MFARLDLKAFGLTSALLAKDAYTYRHCARVARIAAEIGNELGLRDQELGNVYLTGLLHDIGKIAIHDTILQKREPLSADEVAQIRHHVTIGYWILSQVRPLRHLLPGILYHHERTDGTGYPHGLRGERIPLSARIVAVADAYDAMSQPRPYRDAISAGEIMNILTEGSGQQWDRRVVETFLRCWGLT